MIGKPTSRDHLELNSARLALETNAKLLDSCAGVIEGLNTKVAELTKERDTLQRQGAEMRDVLNRVLNYPITPYLKSIVEHALSFDCGKGYVHLNQKGSNEGETK